MYVFFTPSEVILAFLYFLEIRSLYSICFSIFLANPSLPDRVSGFLQNSITSSRVIGMYLTYIPVLSISAFNALTSLRITLRRKLCFLLIFFFLILTTFLTDLPNRKSRHFCLLYYEFAVFYRGPPFLMIELCIRV